MSPDGEAIVTGAGDETLRFWNVFSKTRSTKVGIFSVKIFVKLAFPQVHILNLILVFFCLSGICVSFKSVHQNTISGLLKRNKSL